MVQCGDSKSGRVPKMCSEHTLHWLHYFRSHRFSLIAFRFAPTPDGPLPIDIHLNNSNHFPCCSSLLAESISYGDWIPKSNVDNNSCIHFASNMEATQKERNKEFYLFITNTILIQIWDAYLRLKHFFVSFFCAFSLPTFCTQNMFGCCFAQL